MSRLIDADELKKDDEVTMWLSKDPVRTGKQLRMFSEYFINKIDNMPTVQAIPIPNNATNGDVIKAMFPYDSYGINGNEVHVFGVGGNGVWVFNLNWWNTPYEGE